MGHAVSDLFCYETTAMFLLLFLFTLFGKTHSSSVFHPNTLYFPSFGPDSCSNGQLLCMGSVTAGTGYLSLTPEPQERNSTSSALNNIGRVLYPHPVLAWPAIISTTFTVRITPFPNSTKSGDGMAFVFAQDNRPSPNASHGSYLGLFDRSTQGGGGFGQIAVELDTFMNEFDIDANHIGIDTTSIISPVALVSLDSTGVDLKSGRDIDVKIEHNGLTNMLHLSVGYSGSQLNSVLNHSIVLSNIIPSSVYVGFTASTGKTSPESHQVLKWVFTSVPLPLQTVTHTKRDTINTILIIAIPIFLVALFSSIPFIWEAFRKDNVRRKRKQDIENLSRKAAESPKKFTYKQLSKATCNFSRENLLGSGGFGSVYRGIISDPPKTVAVKKISATSKQGEREFFAEICTIGRLRHKNLVKLQGWCHDGVQLLLVYDYLQNGSLDRFIGKNILDWQTRQRILTGLGSALLYLHEECGNPIVHRDVKPNNVMLDSGFNAYLGDFGLARLHKEDSVTSVVAGTPGYMAPEVGFTGKATPESDVYSFGMVTLEVICGRRSKGMMEENSLVDYVWDLHSKNALLECVDKYLDNRFDEEEVTRALKTGLACLHPDPMSRPKMSKVDNIFQNPNEPLMDLPANRPTGFYESLSANSSASTTDFGSKGMHALLQSSTDSLEEISISYHQQ